MCELITSAAVHTGAGVRSSPLFSTVSKEAKDKQVRQSTWPTLPGSSGLCTAKSPTFTKTHCPGKTRTVAHPGDKQNPLAGI